jgi:hypothetical protein
MLARSSPKMTDLLQARQILQAEKLGFALVRDGHEIARGSASSTHELLAAVDRLGEQARGSSLADKVVGKAVALIAAHAGIVEVYAGLMSQSAVPVLDAHQISWRADIMVPGIMNRRNDDLCPLEQLSQSFDEPAAAVAALRKFFAAGHTPISQ